MVYKMLQSEYNAIQKSADDYYFITDTVKYYKGTTEVKALYPHIVTQAEYDASSKTPGDYYIVKDDAYLYNGPDTVSLAFIDYIGIAIDHAPTKTAYLPTETFDPVGMVVAQLFGDARSGEVFQRTITTDYTYSTAPLVEGTTSITISSTFGDITKSANVAITVQKQALQTPSVSDTLVWNGSTITPNWDNYDSTILTISGDTSASEVGQYSATFTIKNTDKYKWSDNTIAPKTVGWEIVKSDNAFDLDKTSVSLSMSKLSDTVNVTKRTTGNITVSSDATSYADATIDGNTITVTGVSGASGTAHISVTSAADSHYNSVTKTINATMTSTIPVTITGTTGSTSYMYAQIGSTKRTSAGSYTLDAGASIIIGCYSYSSSRTGTIKLNGTTIQTYTGSRKLNTYTYTPTAGTTSITINFAYGSTSYHNANITITEA